MCMYFEIQIILLKVRGKERREKGKEEHLDGILLYECCSH